MSGSSLGAGTGPGRSTGGQIPSVELGRSQPLPRLFPMGFAGVGEVPAVGKLRKGCSHPCWWMGLAGMGPAAPQAPRLDRNTAGTPWAPA